MRKFLPIVLTLAGLAVAFIVYFTVQGKYGGNMNGSEKPDSFPTGTVDGKGIIKPGSGAWSKQYDKDGNLYYQFKTDFYDPQPDGTVKVTHPVIQFFLSGGQVLQIEGETGSIRFAQGTDKGVLTNAPTDPPRYGILQHVTVRLFNSVAEQNAGDAEMTMTMLNAQFDDDTYRLFTEEYVDDAGVTHHADEIPVTVKARDYSFDGSGMELYWNDLDKHLKSLQIDHAKDLTLYNTNGFVTEPGANQTPPPVAEVPAAPAGAAPTPSVPPPPSPAQPGRQRYTATFHDNVRIVQGENSVIEAKEMDVDFAPKGDSGTEESGAPAENPAPAAVDTTSVTPAAPQSQPPAAATAPATQPAEQAIHITWSGTMTMVPTDPNAAPLQPGKAIVRLVGTPVTVHQTNPASDARMDIRCNSLSYFTADSSAHLSGDVMLAQSKGNGLPSTINGQNLDYSRLADSARFNGPGQTEFPDPNDPKTVLRSSWQNACTVRLYDVGQNQTQIDMADLEGNVVVDDQPRFHMTARDNLQLDFDRLTAADVAPGSAAPPLRQITANGDAECIVHDANQQVRQIRGEHLQLLRDPGPDGKLYAKTILCDGDVQAEQEGQSLAAEHLHVDLLPGQATNNPTTNPDAAALDEGAVALDRLIANDNVVVTGKDGSAADAQQLVIHMMDGHPHLSLYGSPAGPAVVKNKNSSLSGWTMRVSPHDQYAEIEGPGTFDGVQQPKDETEKPRPVKLAWSESALVDGQANKVFVDGDVKAASDDPSGSHQSAMCGRIVATLVDVPTTQPAPAVTTQPSKTESFADGADFMKNKQIAAVSLQAASDANAGTQAEAKVESVQFDPAGNFLHQYDLLTHQNIDYNAKTRQISVEGPGNIFAKEAAPATQPSTQPAVASGSGIGGDGTTAIDWKRRFIYNESANSAVIEGDVTVVHAGAGAKSESVTLKHADIIEAEFEPTAPATAGGEPATPKLTQVTATGNMAVVTADKTIYCGEINFDPVHQVLTCDGGARGMVSIVDAKNLDNGSVSEAVFDMKTGQIRRLTNVTGQGRQ